MTGITISKHIAKRIRYELETLDGMYELELQYAMSNNRPDRIQIYNKSQSQVRELIAYLREKTND